MVGKVIQILLPTGNPKEIKKAEIKTDKVEVIQISKKELLSNKAVFDFLGVYILVDDLKADKPVGYIGKGQVKARLEQHLDKKDFWNYAFAIRLKTEDGFNEGHISYLEHFFIDKAKKVNRIVLDENKQSPRKPKLEESVQYEVDDYVSTIEVLLSTLGLKVFEDFTKTEEKQHKFYCKGSEGNQAEGIYTPDGMVIFKGATFRVKLTPSLGKNTLIDRLLAESKIEQSGTLYNLKEDILVNSPSAGSDLVLGRSSNGWIEWKDSKGVLLNGVYTR